MPTILIVLLAPLALAGIARIGLFGLNRSIFGRRDEHDMVTGSSALISFVLLAVSALLFPFFQAVVQRHWTLESRLGEIWFVVTSLIGLYWILHRIYVHRVKAPVPGTRFLGAEVIRLRKAHIPFAFLRRLGAHNDIYDLEVTSHEVVIPDLPEAFEGYKVAFISDTHVAGFMRRAFYREVVNQVHSHGADLVLLGGDYVSFKRHIPLMAELIASQLTAPDGVYAVLGNHDYWADADSVVAAMTVKGVRFLNNKHIIVSRGAARLYVVGMDEVYRGKIDIDAAFRGCDEKVPRVAVTHHPDAIDRLADRRIDLLLCGHTHGGQIRLPVLGAIIVPSVHETLYAAGFFRLGKCLMYVGRGLGSVPPIRILCRPELPIFRLTRQ
ncbi:MAG TPA: metallophosphoesterase [Thermoanaerobaculia bacterium]|nr:metallophosphoesterase [Thermoanaerobaculia bacterium]